jgi:biopolymer transport protein ExbD
MSNTGEPPHAVRGRRRWYQFGLSAILIATALIAILVAWQRPRIERWLTALRGSPTSLTNPDFVTVVVLPDRSVLIDGELLLDKPLAAGFAARFQAFQRAGVNQPKAIVEAHAWSSMGRVHEVLAAMQQAGFREFALRPHVEQKPKTPLRVTPEGMPDNADE